MKDSRNLVRLGDEYGFIISKWLDGYMVKPITITPGSTIRPVFTIRQRKGEFNVYLSGMFETIDDAFDIKTHKPAVDYTALKSAKLKRIATFIGAINWIKRFTTLTESDQLEFLSRHELEPRDKDNTIVFARYFRLERWDKVNKKWLPIDTSINTEAIENLRIALDNGNNKYRVRNTTSRHYHMPTNEYKQLQDSGLLERMSNKPSPVKNGIGEGKFKAYRSANKSTEQAAFWSRK